LAAPYAFFPVFFVLFALILACKKHDARISGKETLEQEIQKRTKELEAAKKNLEEMNTILEIRVAARTEELRALNQTLEEKVRERTFDLQRKIIDLEKFQRLTVGRELKMIELKKK